MANDIRVRVGADTTALQTGMTAAGTTVNAFAARTTVASAAVTRMQAAMTTAGAVGAKAMAGLQAALGPLLVGLGALMGLNSLADAAGQIDDLSQRFGESAESIQRVKVAADQSGTSLETVAKSMNKAELAAVQAAEGNAEMNAAFETLGVSAAEFADLPMEEKLARIAEGYDSNTNKAAALAAMVKIMGKSAGELVPMFAQGGDSIREMMETASVASSDSIGRIAQVQDRFGGMFATLKSWAFDALGFVLDMVDKLSIGIASAIAFVTNLGDGIEAAKEAYNVTMEAGIANFEEEKQAREERSNKISAANIEQIKQEKAQEDADAAKAKEEEAKAKDLAKVTPDKESDADEKAAQALAKEVDRQEAEAFKKLKADKVESAQSDVETVGDRLASLKKQDSKGVNIDSLRRIGGGFAKADYSGVSQREQVLQKQVDLQQKQYDELKKIVEALKKAESFDGIDD